VKRAVGVSLRVAISVGLIGLLVALAWREHVLAKLEAFPAWGIAASAALLTMGWLVNSVRWGLLLRAAGVREHPVRLASLYFIGMFFSQLLPSGAGGDAVRMWDISRRRGSPAAVIVATIQERLVGLGVSMALGLFVTLFYMSRLPPLARLMMIVIPLACMAGVAAGLYPRVPLAMAERAWKKLAASALLKRWTPGRKSRWLYGALRKAADLPPLTVGRLLPVLVVGLIGILFTVGEWYALGRAAGIRVSYAGYCLVVPLVWVLSMAPSLGGAGVREGGFVALMHFFFNVPTAPLIAVAALYLIIQTAIAGAGGLLVLERIWTGSWKRGSHHVIDEPEAASDNAS
jgi:glycosyltransferase 2 family protein